MADAILDSLGVFPDEVDEEAMRACIKFVSNLNMGKGTYQSTTKMRKDLFSKKQLVSDRLPPTEPELTEHIKRADHQSLSGKMQQSRFWNCHLQKEMDGLEVRMVTLFLPKMLILRHRRVLLSLQHVNARLDARTKDVLVRKMSFSVVMLAFAEKDLKTEKQRYS